MDSSASSDDGDAGVERDSDKAMGVSDEISAAVAEQYRRVPHIGTRWTRWYDYPYRLVGGLAYGKHWWSRWPRLARDLASRFQNFLALFNEAERERESPGTFAWDRFDMPDGEQVEYPALWVAEIYTPAYVSTLHERLRSKAWPRYPGHDLPGSTIETTLTSMREEGRGQWSNIGTFLPLESDWLWPDAKREKIPSGVRSIEVTIEAIGPSLTVVAAKFTLDPETAACLDRTIRMDHQPRILRADGRFHLYQRVFQALNAVQGERERVQQSARQWLAQKLPGVFATEDDGKLPVLDLVLTHQFDPLSNNENRRNDNYLRALGIQSVAFRQVIVPGYPGFVLDDYRPERLRSGDHGLWVLQANFDKALGDIDLGLYGEKSKTGRGIAQHVSRGAERLLSRLALSHLVRIKLRDTNRARDLATEIHGGRTPAASVKELRKAILVNSIDIDAIASEASAFSQSRRRYEYGVPSLTLQAGPSWSDPGGLHPREPDPNHLGTLAKDLRRESRRLARADRSLSRLLQIVASLTGALSSMRTQRWAMALSLGALGASAIAAWFAYVAASGVQTP